MRCVRAILLFLLTGLLPAGPTFAQQEANGGSSTAAASSAATPGSVDPDALPINLDRIQRALAQPPAIRPDLARPVFRVEVFGRNLTIAEILGPDFLKGPTPAGPMTHQEFLNLVTPKDVQGYAAFDNKQGMIVAATSFALQWALRQAVQKFQDARTARQKEAARKEVDEALAALRQARREAGLPDK